MKIIARPWTPQDLIDDLQDIINEESDEYLNTRRTTLEMALAYLKEHFAEPKWIPVTERLPEEDGKYLVHKNLWGTSYIAAIWFAKDGEKVCKYDLARKKNVWYEYDSETGYFSVDTVTHWMPLPQPPKED